MTAILFSDWLVLWRTCNAVKTEHAQSTELKQECEKLMSECAEHCPRTEQQLVRGLCVTFVRNIIYVLVNPFLCAQHHCLLSNKAQI